MNRVVSRQDVNPHRRGYERELVIRVDRTLDTQCWCQMRIVRVPIEDVRDGRTRSCGRPDCHA